MSTRLASVASLLIASCASAPSTWAPDCAIWQCASSVLRLPRCDPAKPLQPEPWVADPVVVEGSLREDGAMCTTAGCAPYTCCNDCSSMLVLDMPDGSRLLLLGELEGRTLACRGDDSLGSGCCPLPTDGTVLRLIGRRLPPDALSTSYSASASFEASAGCVVAEASRP